ncbi:MAG: DUF721 domain-containing protein [Desulfosalsimonadaceae bacterium]
MAPSGRDPSEFTHISSIIDTVLPRGRREANAQMAGIREIWNRVLPAEVTENAQPEALKNDVLLVHVTSSPVTQQLRFLTEEIKQHLNAPSGARTIRAIKFKVGKVKGDR